MTFKYALLALALTGIAVTGCSRIRDTQGYIGDPELMAAVKPGVDNKASVAKSLGRPSIASQWDDREWYYLSRETRQFAFRDPRPASQTVMKVSFDAKGNVTKVDRRGLELAANIDPEGDKTPTLGKDRNFWQALFGNIGRVGSGPNQGGAADPDNTGGP